MTIQIDTIELYFIIFFMLMSCTVSCLLLYKYFTHGYAIQEEIDEMMNYSSVRMKEELDKNLENQIQIYNKYIDNAQELTKASIKEFTEAKKVQFDSFDNFRTQMEYVKQDLQEMHKKIKRENELQKDIRERDGIIARKNREILKLKARINDAN